MLSCLSCISWRRCSNTPSVSHTWKQIPMVASHWPVTTNFVLSISACCWYFQLLTHQAGVLLDVSYGFSFVCGHHFYCCLLIKYWLWALYLFMWNTHRCFKKYVVVCFENVVVSIIGLYEPSNYVCTGSFIRAMMLVVSSLNLIFIPLTIPSDYLFILSPCFNIWIQVEVSLWWRAFALCVLIGVRVSCCISSWICQNCFLDGSCFPFEY